MSTRIEGVYNDLVSIADGLTFNRFPSVRVLT